MEASRDAILAALAKVIDPELRRPVTELDMVRDVEIEDVIVSLTIVLTVAGCPLRDSFEQQVERALSGVDGVGKSSLTANLAVAFSQLGRKTGVLDADIYGHSIPHILGIHQKPVAVDQMIVPPVKDTLKLMSIGFFLDDNEPVMWRGPMLHRALEQFLTDVQWGDIDVLVVDMPPGTGDVSISLGQLLPRAEALVVTTPQPLAQEVAIRAARMAQKTGMRLLGVVENMSGDVFGSGGGERLADELGIPLLGTVELDPLLRECGDAGAPLMVTAPDSDTGLELRRIAESVLSLDRGSIVKPLTLVSR